MLCCCLCFFFFFFKQKTAYEMRISDWSSDVCSSDLASPRRVGTAHHAAVLVGIFTGTQDVAYTQNIVVMLFGCAARRLCQFLGDRAERGGAGKADRPADDLQCRTAVQSRVRVGARQQIGRAHVCTPVTNAHLVCRLLLEKKKL